MNQEKLRSYITWATASAIAGLIVGTASIFGMFMSATWAMQTVTVMPMYDIYLLMSLTTATSAVLGLMTRKVFGRLGYDQND